MDYKSMNDSDLIHLISNQILNQNITENNKLVIQDCCKELFIKKCDKYKKVTYTVIKKPNSGRNECDCCGSPLMDCIQETFMNTDTLYECDCERENMDYDRTRIMPTSEGAGVSGNPMMDFPFMIYLQQIKCYDEGRTCIIHNRKKTYVVTKIEGI